MISRRRFIKALHVPPGRVAIHQETQATIPAKELAKILSSSHNDASAPPLCINNSKGGADASSCFILSIARTGYPTWRLPKIVLLFARDFEFLIGARQLLQNADKVSSVHLNILTFFKCFYDGQCVGSGDASCGTDKAY